MVGQVYPVCLISMMWFLLSTNKKNKLSTESLILLLSNFVYIFPCYVRSCFARSYAETHVRLFCFMGGNLEKIWWIRRMPLQQSFLSVHKRNVLVRCRCYRENSYLCFLNSTPLKHDHPRIPPQEHPLWRHRTVAPTTLHWRQLWTSSK